MNVGLRSSDDSYNPIHEQPASYRTAPKPKEPAPAPVGPPLMPKWPEKATDAEIAFWEEMCAKWIGSDAIQKPNSSDTYTVPELADLMCMSRRQRFGVR